MVLTILTQLGSHLDSTPKLDFGAIEVAKKYRLGASVIQSLHDLDPDTCMEMRQQIIDGIGVSFFW
jgi:hypothetical protein